MKASWMKQSKQMNDAGDNAQPKKRTRKPKVSKDEQAAEQQADEAIAQPKKRAKVMKKPAARPSRKRGPDGPPDDERVSVEQVYQHTLFDVYWNRPAIGATGPSMIVLWFELSWKVQWGNLRSR